MKELGSALPGYRPDHLKDKNLASVSRRTETNQKKPMMEVPETVQETHS
jgi:hypothetical protein